MRIEYFLNHLCSVNLFSYVGNLYRVFHRLNYRLMEIIDVVGRKDIFFLDFFYHPTTVKNIQFLFFAETQFDFEC